MSEQIRNPDGTFASKPKVTKNGQQPDEFNHDSSGVIDININDIADEKLRNDVKMLLEERNSKNSLMQEMADRLRKMDEREQQSKYNRELEEKHQQLTSLNIKLAEKHKDEKDLEKLDLLISIAQDLANGFPDYNKEPEKPKGKFAGGREHPTRFNALTGQME